MKTDNGNVLIKQKYEIHLEGEYAVVKRLSPLKYIRVRGNSYRYIVRLVNTLNDQSKCEAYLTFLFSLLKDQSKKGVRLGFSMTSTGEGILKKFLSCIPTFLLSNQSAIITILAASVLYLLLFPYLLPPSSQSSNYFFYLCGFIVNLALHESGHVIGCLAAGRDVHEFGFKLNFGFPMLFVDTTDICMSSLKNRVFTSLAGVYANSLLCLGFSFLFIAFDSQTIASFATISFCFIISNLIPFFKLDGYFVLAELLSEPMLKDKAKQCFISVVTKHQKLNTYTLTLALYFLTDSVFIVGVIIYAIRKLLEIFI